MNYSQTVIAVDLDDASTKTLSQVSDHKLPAGSTVHLVHVVEVNYLSLLPQLQLSSDYKSKIENNVLEKLKQIQKSIGLENSSNCILQCLISMNAKQEFLNYADKIGATLIVAAAKEREGFKGLFESSFTNFLNKFSHTNLLILRPIKQKS
ncbi:MAG: universal stress protein [Bacteriovoracaceae bacterium]